MLDTMNERRESEIEDVGTVEAFKEPMSRLDPELKNWHFWRKWRYCLEQDLYDWERPGIDVTLREDLTDQHYYALPHGDTDTPGTRSWIYKRERERRIYGLWMFLPWFLDLSKEEQVKAFEERPHQCIVQCLTGSHYFFLTYTHIIYDTGSQSGVYDFPLLRRRDAWLHLNIAISQRLELAEGEYRPGLDTPKARRIGYTTNLLAAIVNFITLYPRKRVSIHVHQGDQCKDYHIYNLAPMLQYMPGWFLNQKPSKGGIGKEPFITTDITKHNVTVTIKSWDYQKGKAKESNEYSSLQIVGPDSKYVESGRFDWIYRDEVPKWDTDKVTSYIKNQDQSIFNAMALRRTGVSISGGTSNSTNPKGLDAWRKRRKSLKQNHCYMWFGGRQYYNKIDEYGWAREQEHIDFELKERRMLEAIGDYEGLRDKRLQEAIYPDDCYISGSSSWFNAAICHVEIERIREQLMGEVVTPRYGWFIPNPSNPFQPGWHDCVGGEIPKWTLYSLPPDNWCVGNLQNPPPISLVYSAGSDNTEMDMSGRERELKLALEGRGKHSLSSMYIINTVTGEMVAQYLYRHANPDEDHEQKMMACMYYGCRVMSENNVPGEINYFRAKVYPGIHRGFFLKRYMHPTPKLPEFPSKGRDSYGVSTKNTKAMLIREYLIKLFMECHGLWHSERLMQDLAEWSDETGAKSPDTGMAMLMSSIARRVNLEAKQDQQQHYVSKDQLAWADALAKGSSKFRSLGMLHRV